MGAAALLAVTLLSAQSPWLTLETGKHGGAIRRVDVDSAGERVLSTSEDGTARLFSLESGVYATSLLAEVDPRMTVAAATRETSLAFKKQETL